MKEYYAERTTSTADDVRWLIDEVERQKILMNRYQTDYYDALEEIHQLKSRRFTWRDLFNKT